MKNQIYFLLLFCIYISLSCSTKHENKKEKPYWIKSINCDFEKVFNSTTPLIFTTDSSSINIQVNGVINKNIFRSGSTSVQIDSTQKKPLLKLTNLNSGQLIEYSFWQYKGNTSAKIMAVNGTNNKVYQSNYIILGKSKKGWKQHFISIPIIENNSTIECYIKTTDSIAVFDDLEIKIYPVMPKNEIIQTLHLYIPNKSKNKLNNYIFNGLDKKVIPETSKKYVTAYMINGADSSKLKMKLKGDWTDHIKPDKASYRIKLSKSSAYKRMVNFSIQHPKTRNFLNEWVIHKIAEDKDILTTTYDFINVTINDYNSGIYALEEHFDKHIIENRKRREGPILKLDESGMWAFQQEKFNNGLETSFPFFESSVISVFKKNRTLKSPSLKTQFDDAKNLVQLFKSGHLNIEEIFNLDQLALYYAIIELGGNYHPLTWHNRRFYFNPITQKLETILFDVIPYPNHNISVMKDIITNTEKEKNLILDNALILNRAFKEKYIYYIKQLTSKEYLDPLFINLDEDIRIIYPALKNEKPEYEFSKKDFYAQAQFILDGLDDLNSSWETILNKVKDVDYWMKDEKYPAVTDSTFIPEISINTYFQKIENGKYKLWIENYHLNEIRINSYNGGNSNSTINLKKELVLDRYQSTKFTHEIYVDSLPKSINYTVNNKSFSKKVIPWKLPHGTSSRMNIKHADISYTKLYTIKDKQLIFNKNCVIEELLYIPNSYEVIINAGTSIELKNGGGIIINNSLSCIGTKEDPINIFCLDKTSKGITVLNGKTAKISFTTLKGLSPLKYKNWTQTGAFTIYETQTQINNLTISNNYSEDALNVIRSNFEIFELFISNTTSDGFDADFCTGKLSNSTFTNTGNDCIDFSGSEIIISNIKILNSGDKGISGGESSILHLENIRINGAITAIASKDNSVITGKSITIENTQFGFSAFQKKATYGPAKIELTNCISTNTDQRILVELNSSIKINSILYKGELKLDIDELYKSFNK